MRIKHIAVLFIMLITHALTTSAQKLFTLEDLNYGGVNYHKMVPENRYLTWWGDELIRTEADYCSVIDKKNYTQHNDYYSSFTKNRYVYFNESI